MNIDIAFKFESIFQSIFQSIWKYNWVIGMAQKVNLVEYITNKGMET